MTEFVIGSLVASIFTLYAIPAGFIQGFDFAFEKVGDAARRHSFPAKLITMPLWGIGGFAFGFIRGVLSMFSLFMHPESRFNTDNPKSVFYMHSPLPQESLWFN